MPAEYIASPRPPGGEQHQQTAPSAASAPDLWANPPTPKGGARRIVLGVGLGVLALALVAGVAFATTQVLSALTGGGNFLNPKAPVATSELKVTGRPPSTAGSWSSGTRELWRVRADRSGGFDDGTGYDWVQNLRPDGWQMGFMVGDVSYLTKVLDPGTGQTVWEFHGSSVGPQSCSETAVDGLVPCLIDSGLHELKNDVLAWHDWSTGDIVGSVPLADLDLVGDYSTTAVRVVDGQVVLVLPRFDDYLEYILGGMEEPRLLDVTVAKLNKDGTATDWVTKRAGCYGYGDSFTGSRASLHGLLSAGHGVIVDETSGESLLPDGVCGAIEANNTIRVRAEDKAKVSASLKAPDGSQIFVTVDENHLTFPAGPLESPLRVIGIDKAFENQGRVGIEAFNSESGQSLWSEPFDDVTGTWYDDGFLTASAIDSNGRTLLLDAKTLHSIDSATGKLIWQRPLPDQAFSSIQVAEDGTVMLHTSGPQDYVGKTAALDPTTGDEYWEMPGHGTLAPDPEGHQSLLMMNNTVSRLVPASRTVESPEFPSDAPACPDEMSPLSWTRYEGGSVLVCQQGQQFVVITPEQPRWVAEELIFVDGGFEVVFAGDFRVRMALGGAWVIVDENGQTSQRPVVSSWTSTSGYVNLDVPDGLPSCPVDTWPVSLSTFDGGWLLVCGKSASEPVRFVYANGGRVVESDQVTYNAGVYCSATEVGEICAFHTPAMISLTDTGGSITQHSVTTNYFGGLGQGGAGAGQGAYGVAAPKPEAQDQVRYLTEILQKSAVGRANINKAVDQVRACSDVPGAISTMQGVTANREELLTALDSAPVDAIPDGANLVAKLRRAIELSRDSDLVWVQWAESEEANGCTLGENNPLYQQVRSMNLNVATAKDQFVDDWNGRIVPNFQAPAFTRGEI